MSQHTKINVTIPDQERIPTSATRRGVIRWSIREVLGVLFVPVTLFIPAGRLDWPMGWALVGIYTLWTAASALILIPNSPELLAERATRRKDMTGWDAKILGVIGLSTLAKHILAGLDFRLGWTAQVPPALQIFAMVMAALGYAVGTWAMSANEYFSLVNRIQADRGHAVVSGGPYRYVRHPAYSGTLVFELVTPIMLGSIWALIPGALNALLIIGRTALEDRMLHRELSGYSEFARGTRYRLLPGVW